MKKRPRSQKSLSSERWNNKKFAIVLKMDSHMKTMNPKGYLRFQDFVQMFLVMSAISLSTYLIFNSISKRRRKLRKHMEEFPGLRRFPLLGNTLQLLEILRSPTTVLLPWVDRMCEKYGKVFRFWLFEDPRLFVCCADTALYLLNKDLVSAKSKQVNHYGKLLGADGLLSCEPEMHSVRRKMWAPSFIRKRFENAMITFRVEGLKLCQDLEQYCSPEKGEPIIFNFYEHSIRCAFRAICREAFGSEYTKNLPEFKGQEHNQSLHTIGKNLTWRFFRPWLNNDSIFLNFTSTGRETKKCIKIGHEVARKAIQARKKLRESAGCTVESFGDQKLKGEVSHCFLDHLLDQMDIGALSESEVLDELNTFITAGYDTSGTAICYTLYLLSLYPEYQDRVVEELHDIFGKEIYDLSKYEMTLLDTKNMKVMEQCIKESLRMYPIVPILLRRTASDAELWDGRIIPEGVDVYINVLKIHNDPKLFPEPEKFKPERHLSPNPGWMPFSLGSRNCIGQVFAMYEMKVILAYLLLSYKFETVEKEGFTPMCQPVYVPKEGMRFKITKRNHPKQLSVL